MKTKSLILLGVSGLALHTSALGSIIDDKSQFVGDFTVIDFETRGDGTVIDNPISLRPDEYSDSGVFISLAFLPPFQGSRPVVGSPVDDQFNAALRVGGSPVNILGDGRTPGFIRSDFSVPVNAVGWVVIDRPYLPVTLEAFDASDILIEGVSFAGDLIDGTVPGSTFGTDYDVNYGFFGLYSPGTEIAYVVMTEALTMVDDLHFGVIPDPATGLLLLVGVPLLFKRRRDRIRFGLHATRTLVVLSVAGVTAQAWAADVSGKVAGCVTAFNGAYLPDCMSYHGKRISLVMKGGQR